MTREMGCTMRLLRFGRFMWVIWKVVLPYRELRIVDEHGFRAWAELATEGVDPVPPLPSTRG
jgi:hypothetical protein